MADSSLGKLVEKLFDIEAVKFGQFKIKSGLLSPVYFDLRVIVSFPQIMRDVAEHMYQAVVASGCNYSSICGVPYTALPIATCICSDHNIPMLIRRKEAKGYGTRKMIEGKYAKGDMCLIVEDVVTSGSSVLETVQSLHDEGLVVKDAVVLLNREQGGTEYLASHGIRLHSICTISQLMDLLHAAGRVDSETVNQVKHYVASNQAPPPSVTVPPQPAKVLSYSERQALASHPLSKQLFQIMNDKCTNLALSADVTSSDELIKLADTLGPHICILKTHIDILEDFSPEVTKQLSTLAEKHNYLIFEDRKFADIGNTVKQQYGAGMYRIADWSHIINAHGLPGPGIIQGLKEIGISKHRGLLLLAQMSSKGSLAQGDYTKEIVKMAEADKDFVIGFISREKVSDDACLVHMTPGVQLEQGGDALGQQYLTPHDVITKNGSDIIIVGRGITQSPDPKQTAIQYQEAGHSAYLCKVNSKD